MDKLLNFILFQIGWFSAVLGGASGRPWFGVIVICFIVLFRLSRVDSIKEELALILIIAVILGTASNGFAKGAQGFTLLVPSILTAITIVGCMFTLSIVMKTIPVGITYASFAGLCIIATTMVGIYKFNQMPDIYTIAGLILIIAGVLIVNLLGKAN